MREINELSRAVYSTCNLCAKNPNAPPLWDIRARSAVQDVEHKMIEYHDAVVEMYGIPVLYTPYLSHPDPSAEARQRDTGAQLRLQLAYRRLPARFPTTG